jgi:ABC-type amino acid transport substrate-binding protein
MQKRILKLWYLSFTFIFLFAGCKKEESDNYHFEFQFITENYAPFNYESEGQITGLAPDLLKEITHGLSIPFEVELMPWEESYSILQNTDNAVLFSMALNAERKDLFKWAGPFAALEWRFYASSQSNLIINSMDDAKAAESIGVLADYAVTLHLESLGFTNLVYFNNHQEAFQHLLDGEIDLYPSDLYSAKSALENIGYLYYNVRSVWPIKTDLLYFAFNKNVPDDVIADFQSEIDKLKSNGYLQQLSQKYLNTADYPGKLQIYTEDYPPLTFLNSFGEISGFGADIVYEIMHRENIYEDITLTAWGNAYNMALHNPNFCLFTMDRTPIREDLFQWVGPIGTNDTYFYLKQGSDITISSIEEAMNLDAVATVSSWFSHQHLESLGFTNLVPFAEPGAAVDAMMDEQVDAFVCTSITIADILRANGYAFSDVIPEFVLMSSDFYISFSNGTSEDIVNQWQQTLDAMQADGTYDAIYERWFPE